MGRGCKGEAINELGRGERRSITNGLMGKMMG